VIQQQVQHDEVKVIRGGMSSANPPAAAAGGLGLFTPGAR
jgi:hypothetical protein